MRPSLPVAAATDTWIAIAVSIAFALLVVAPVLMVCLYAVWRRGPDANRRAVDDVERFIELRDRARAELAATGSLDRFVALKDQARKHLWPSAADRERRRRDAPDVTVEPAAQERRAA